MSMNENLPEPPTDAGLPTPEVPIDAPAVEDVTVPEAVAEAAPVEAPLRSRHPPRSPGGCRSGG